MPPEFQAVVQTKVKKQLHVNDAKGLVLKPDSSLSEDIARSPELRYFIKSNLENILSGKSITGSACFESNKNLLLSIKNADIIGTHLNQNGDIVCYVLDTYDFNAGELFLIEWARNLQLNGYITGYYSLAKVVIPIEEWSQW